MMFANPEYFLLLLFVPLMIYWYWKKQKRQLVELTGIDSTGIPIYSAKLATKIASCFVFVLRVLTIILLTIALARPQSTSKGENVSTEGIDIVSCQRYFRQYAC